jgi:hypothetical protein
MKTQKEPWRKKATKKQLYNLNYSSSTKFKMVRFLIIMLLKNMIFRELLLAIGSKNIIL